MDQPQHLLGSEQVGRLLNGRQRQAAGFSLVELMVVIAVMGVLLMLGFKSFAGWLQSLRVRAAAESIRTGCKSPRPRRSKRNGNVTFLRWSMA